MIATINGFEYISAGDAYWDAELMRQRYMGEFPDRVHRLDVKRIRESYQQALKFAREHGKDVSMFPLELNLLLQSEGVN